MSTQRAFAGASLAAAAALFAGLLATGSLFDRAAVAAENKDAKASDPAAIASLEAVKARAAVGDYTRAKWDPIHFKPAIDHARDEACLVCHKEINNAKPRDVSPAGVKAADTLAWYQTLDTYAGTQQDFHWRHIQSPYAKSVMNLSCNFCHQGNDPREESPHVTASDGKGAIVTSWRDGAPPFTLRKMVNPTETCLRCHGTYPAEIMGLSGTWAETREGLESPEAPNGCLSCHAEQFRTNRHKVAYLKNEEIEKLAQKSSDVCFGCHGGRQWYRISYKYPRHAWPGMPAETPDWAQGRPTESDARFLPPAK